MSFSAELLELAKTKLGLTKDAQLVELIGIEKGNLSKVRNGSRPLSDVQALAIAEKCGFDAEWVLVSLAADTTKSEAVKTVWCSLAKKLLTGALVFCVLSLHGICSGPEIGKRVFLRRSRLFA